MTAGVFFFEEIVPPSPAVICFTAASMASAGRLALMRWRAGGGVGRTGSPPRSWTVPGAAAVRAGMSGAVGRLVTQTAEEVEDHLLKGGFFVEEDAHGKTLSPYRGGWGGMRLNERPLLPQQLTARDPPKGGLRLNEFRPRKAS